MNKSVSSKIKTATAQDMAWLSVLPRRFTSAEAGERWGIKAVSARWRLVLLRCSGLVDYRRNGTLSGEWRRKG